MTNAYKAANIGGKDSAQCEAHICFVSQFHIVRHIPKSTAVRSINFTRFLLALSLHNSRQGPPRYLRCRSTGIEWSDFSSLHVHARVFAFARISRARLSLRRRRAKRPCNRRAACCKLFRSTFNTRTRSTYVSHWKWLARIVFSSTIEREYVILSPSGACVPKYLDAIEQDQSVRSGNKPV